jgi:hypothetical protein
MKTVKVCGQKTQGENMTHLITQSELEHLSDTQLHLMLNQINFDIAQEQQFTQSCSLAEASAENIKAVLLRRWIEKLWP